MPSLILALRFLTLGPVPGREASGPGALGQAAWWFPLVGLLLGGVLALADRALALLFSPLLAALLVVALWKVATGGIHLDGLADSLDALGGHDRERRLAITRDSRIGAFGAVGLILCFLIAIAALSDLPASVRWLVLLAAPALGRIAPGLVGACFHPATPREGSGAGFLGGLSRWTGPVHVAAAAAALWLAFGARGWLMLGAALAAMLLWSALMAGRLGGLTGDALGGAVEVSELAALVAAAALAHRRWI